MFWIPIFMGMTEKELKREIDRRYAYPTVRR